MRDADRNAVSPTDPASPVHNPADDPPPRHPAEPGAADCCGEGCVRCVYDLYEDALERYQAELAAWRARHP
ncbi:hypothetical protein EAH75_01085 [Rhodanobacter glycinis]|nr:hypothetical protein EAH75_01085 [Rhodanobacter glycinis]